MGKEGHPSEHSSSPFIWFYLSPLAQPPMIGVHNPSSSPNWGERGFLADGLFSKGNHFFLSLYCPVLSWLQLTFLLLLQFPLLSHSFSSFHSVKAPASLCSPSSSFLNNKDEVTRNGSSALDLILHIFQRNSFHRTLASPLPLLLGWMGDAALWLDAQEDVLSPVNIVIG